MKVSLIMVTWAPTKERMELLRQTFRYLEGSTEIPYELIVIDNGPEKQTKFLKAQNIDVHLINGENKGIGYGRNQALALATGDYICYIDNDLIFSKDWLKEGIEALEKYPDRKLITSTVPSQHQIRGSKSTMRKYYVGVLDEYLLWRRGSPGGTILKRKHADEIGAWQTHTKPGTKYCDVVYRKKFLYISLPFPKVMHRGIFSSYDYKEKMKDGKWMKEWKL